MALLDIQGVNKHFDKLHVLHDVDLSVEAGEALVLLGPSGSGKSTLLRCVNGLEEVDSGSVTVDGTDITRAGRKIAAIRAEIGMVFQNFNLFPHLTALENVAIGPLHVKKVSRQAARERGLELLAKVGIAEKADAYPAELSGGQQQRVAIARGLAMEPKLMMFDEPTSALDPEMIKEVVDVMAALSAEGMTMLVVTHEMGFARHAANRIAFMDAGRIVEQGAPEAFFNAPSNQRTREFLSKILAH